MARAPPKDRLLPLENRGRRPRRSPWPGLSPSGRSCSLLRPLLSAAPCSPPYQQPPFSSPALGWVPILTALSPEIRTTLPPGARCTWACPALGWDLSLTLDSPDQRAVGHSQRRREEKALYCQASSREDSVVISGSSGLWSPPSSCLCFSNA